MVAVTNNTAISHMTMVQRKSDRRLIINDANETLFYQDGKY